MRALLLLVVSACSGQTFYKQAIGWERWRAQMAVHSVTVDGHAVPFLEGGRGETIVLVHGFGADKDSWLPFAKYLTADYHVIALDVPGFGDSTRDPSAHYDIPTQARRLEAFLASLGVERAHLVGNSMGGAIALEYTLLFPRRVTTLFLVDAAGVKTPEPSEVRKLIEKGDNPLVVATVADFDRLMAFNFVKPPVIPESIKAFFVERAAKNRAFTEKIFADMNTPPLDMTGDLARVQARTLIVWGDTDRIIHPSAAKVFAAGIPGARLIIIEHCGHAPTFERPEEVSQRYVDFLNGK